MRIHDKGRSCRLCLRPKSILSLPNNSCVVTSAIDEYPAFEVFVVADLQSLTYHGLSTMVVTKCCKQLASFVLFCSPTDLYKWLQNDIIRAGEG